VRGSCRKRHTIGQPPSASATSQRRYAASPPTPRLPCGACCFALFKFRRQVPFQSFILDFVCFEKRFIIEIDGSPDTASERDTTKDAVLVAAGFRTARYRNNDVLQQPSAVLEDILAKLAER
jgi:very-short-patch-repair endonuclease